MSAADQRAVIAALRQVPPEGWDRWTTAVLATAAGLKRPACDAAIRSLRMVGKVRFGALELSPSMLTDDEYHAKAGDDAEVERASEAPAEPVSRPAGGRTPAATSELMDATAGENAPVSEVAAAIEPVAMERLDDLGSVQDGLHKCPRTGSAVTRLVGDPVGGPVKPPPNSRPPRAAGVASPAPAVPAPLVGDPTAGAGDPLSPSQVLGAALLAEIEAYVARTGVKAWLLGELALTHSGFVPLLRKRGTARPETAETIRAFMARWPDGATRDDVRLARIAEAEAAAAEQRAASIAAAPGDGGMSLADEVKAEALASSARRIQARCTGTVKNPLSANVVGIQRALLAEPEDAFVFLRRKWPSLLRNVIAAAQAEEVTPATMLASAIGVGLATIAVERLGVAE